MATPTWSLSFRTQNRLLQAVPQGIHYLVVTATTSKVVASLATIVWFIPTVPPLRAKHLLASHHRDICMVQASRICSPYQIVAIMALPLHAVRLSRQKLKESTARER